MVNSLVTTAVRTGVASGVGSALIGSSGVAGAIGTAATVVTAPWFLPLMIVSGVLIGGLTANGKSKKEIDDVNSYFD